jgi:hypothetical protein
MRLRHEGIAVAGQRAEDVPAQQDAGPAVNLRQRAADLPARGDVSRFPARQGLACGGEHLRGRVPADEVGHRRGVPRPAQLADDVERGGGRLLVRQRGEGHRQSTRLTQPPQCFQARSTS